MKAILAVAVCASFSLAVAASSNRAVQSSFFTYLAGPSARPSLIAFSPTHHDPRPGANHLVPSRQSLAEDLGALRPAFDGLILYGYDKETTPVILAEARREGYRAVLLGIWDPTSRDELEGTAELVHNYQDKLTLAICVGNEGIAFDRYTLNDVRKAIGLIRELLGRDSQVPVCTSEPIDEYIDGNLRQVGDFLCPNIHTVFEHREKNAADAVRWVHRLALSLAEGGQKPVLVKETGFPHGGDDHFTPEVQQSFWSAYLKAGRLAHSPSDPRVWVSYAAAFEAFDLHWKAEQSNLAVEALWGVLTPDRTPYPAFLVWQGARASGSTVSK
jgi:exo-beta-1,3-glucanase (GH17 family)